MPGQLGYMGAQLIGLGGLSSVAPPPPPAPVPPVQPRGPIRLNTMQLDLMVRSGSGSNPPPVGIVSDPSLLFCLVKPGRADPVRYGNAPGGLGRRPAARPWRPCPDQCRPGLARARRGGHPGGQCVLWHLARSQRGRRRRGSGSGPARGERAPERSVAVRPAGLLQQPQLLKDPPFESVTDGATDKTVS